MSEPIITALLHAPVIQRQMATCTAASLAVIYVTGTRLGSMASLTALALSAALPVGVILAGQLEMAEHPFTIPLAAAVSSLVIVRYL